MTVLVGLIRADGVSIVADRAATYDGPLPAQNTPWPAGDITKVYASQPRDGHQPLTAGIAGKATAPNLDLTSRLPFVVNATTDVRQAALAVANLVDSALGDHLRHHAGRAATVATPFNDPVITIVLLGGPSRRGHTLIAVGLLAAGGARSVDLNASVVYAPTSVEADAGLTLLGQDPNSSIGEARDVWLDRIRDLASTAAKDQRIAITPECDHATVSQAGASGVRRHTPPSRPMPYV